MGDFDATPAFATAARLATATSMAPFDETGRLDRQMVGVVEDSPANFVSGRLGLGELRDEDLASILRCVDSLDYVESVDHLLMDIANGFKAVFRLSPGLMILEILKRGNERELFVYWLEGKNMFRQLRFIKRAVIEIAEANNCNRLGAAVHDERWAKKLLKTFPGGTLTFSLSVEL